MVIDVPGTYTLEPTSKAEKVALEMLKDGGVVINIIDAANLERLGDLSIKPLTGIPIAISVIYCTFWVIRFIGESLIG